MQGPSEQHVPKSRKRRRTRKWKFHYNKRQDTSDVSALSFSLQLSKEDSKEMTAESEDGRSNSLFIESDSDEIPKVLDAMEEEIERQLEEKAQKTNLTVANVKNMLKAVITNRDVMKMVNYSLQRSSEKPDFAPKLTRAKTKELMEKEAIPVCRIPIVKKKSELEDLIAQDLTEDSSDEEYKPLEDWSDEESKTSGTIIAKGILNKEKDKPSKTNVNILNDNENIGQRTRSKLCLSKTPLETIEKAFIPPDITTDMYNTECDNQDWANFLKEFMEPLDNNITETMDDENDPEYNVMADEEHENPDIEELRVDRAVKVSKKELNDLMSELFEFTNMMSSDEEDCQKNNDETDQKNVEPETGPSSANACLHSDGVTCGSSNNELKQPPQIIVEVYDFIKKDQLLLLKQQFRQHVQLLTQSYLMSYGNPLLSDTYKSGFKELLVGVNYLQNDRLYSAFNVINLESSLLLIEEWEKLVNATETGEKINRFILQEDEKVKLCKEKRVVYYPKIPEELMRLCFSSKAFIYPLLLPSNSFRSDDLKSAFFSNSENMLLAIGLEEFTDYFEKNGSEDWTFHDVVSMISSLLVPNRSTTALLKHIKKMKTSDRYNPIQYMYKHKRPPEINHFIVPIDDVNLKKLSEQPLELLPVVWANMLNKMKGKIEELE